MGSCVQPHVMTFNALVSTRELKEYIFIIYKDIFIGNSHIQYKPYKRVQIMVVQMLLMDLLNCLPFCSSKVGGLHGKRIIVFICYRREAKDRVEQNYFELREAVLLQCILQR